MSELRLTSDARPETGHLARLISLERRGELFALIVLASILIVMPVTVLGYQFVLRRALSDVYIFDIVAAAPEAGGFQPDAIRVPAGERVRLRFSVPDVTHGIAIGPGLGLDLGHVDPGQVKEVEVTFARPGRYTVYCNSWCSPNHWRMRGSIEVYDPQDPDALPESDLPDPTLKSLAARGVDIDAPHEARVVPVRQPSPARGTRIIDRLDKDFRDAVTKPGWQRMHSPVEAWESLTEIGLSEAEAWDVVAYLWLAELETERREIASRLYAKNCAACHGETGDGRGPGVDGLAAQGGVQQDGMSMVSEPTAFADPRVMLGGSSDVYYAKLRRGGMGTGMPSFGPILTPEETWILVDYLWTFVFQPEGQTYASENR